jgi:hypothetical protein
MIDMTGRFYEGERIVLTPGGGFVERPRKVLFGTLVAFVKDKYPYYVIDWDTDPMQTICVTAQQKGSEIGLRDDGTFYWARTCNSYPNPILTRLNEVELREGFDEALQGELSRLKTLAQGKDVEDSAMVLTTVRNLVRTISKDTVSEMKETERLGELAGINERAATLATLRNLNTFLRESSSPKTKERLAK